MYHPITDSHRLIARTGTACIDRSCWFSVLASEGLAPSLGDAGSPAEMSHHRATRTAPLVCKDGARYGFSVSSGQRRRDDVMGST
jgi:hypothetical protein